MNTSEASIKTNQKQKVEKRKYQNQEWKKDYHHRSYRRIGEEEENTMDLCQQFWQHRWNGQIPWETLFPKWIQGEIYNLNKSIYVNEIEFVALHWEPSAVGLWKGKQAMGT